MPNYGHDTTFEHVNGLYPPRHIPSINRDIEAAKRQMDRVGSLACGPLLSFLINESHLQKMRTPRVEFLGAVEKDGCIKSRATSAVQATSFISTSVGGRRGYSPSPRPSCRARYHRRRPAVELDLPRSIGDRPRRRIDTFPNHRASSTRAAASIRRCGNSRRPSPTLCQRMTVLTSS